MKVEDQVCTLEQAKRLKELGVKQEGLFCFIGDENPDPRYNEPMRLFYESEAIECGKSWYDNRIAAFTVAELGVMLPDMFASRHGAAVWICYSDGEHERKYNVNMFNSCSNTEAQARAAMLIYLLENNLITIDEINARI